MMFVTNNRGFSVIEALIALSIFVVIFLFIYETLTIYFANQNRLLESTQALYLAEAGHEYLRYLRDGHWDNLTDLTNGTDYYFTVTPDYIATTTSPSVINTHFTRGILVWPAYRDANDDYVASTTAGATADTGSYEVTSYVTWKNGERVQLKTILGNLQNQ